MAGRMRKVLGEAGRAAYLISSRAVGYLLLGILINVALLALLGSELGSLAAGGPPTTGGAGAIATGLISTLKYKLGLVGIAGLFGIVFPLVYFILGKSQGVRGAINALAARRTEALVGYVSHKALEWARARPDWQARLEKGGLQQAIEQLGPTFFEKLPGVPRAMRALIRVLRKKVPLAESVLEAISQTAGNEHTSEQHLTEEASRTSTDLRKAIEEHFSPPDLLLPAIVVAVNLSAFAAVKLLL